MRNVRWLLVGAGDIARKRVAPALASAAGSEVVGVCDVREEEARRLAADLGATGSYSRLEEALAASPADAVYIATPVWLHVPQAVSALESGRHVLVEKPLGLNAAECARAVAAAERSGKVAGCAYFRRLFPRYQHTRQMLEDGEFGRVVHVRLTYFSWFAPTPDDPKYWRVVRAKSGGGPLSDMGTHMFDVLIGLFGLPVSVDARCENLVHAWDVEDSAGVLFQLPDGAQGVASFHWNSKTWRHEFEMVGTEAKIDWLPYDTGPVVKTVGREITDLQLPSAENVHLPLVEDFVQAVREGRAPVCPLEEAAKTNRLLDAIYRSAAERREVAV
ncbi:MAG: Gfo/Idh/MocA family oxidoreductase [Armatimonadetes bacterium]|nr:Gfo/Idh/MocA family oxidoreductase [Armatimonadota bacterium]